MFTQRRILLSELAKAADIRILRDAEIAFAGKIPTALDGRVVPASSVEHLEAAAQQNGIAAIIVPGDLVDHVPQAYGLAVSDQPLAALAKVQAALASREGFQWDHFETRIDPSAKIDPSAHVAARDVVIGAGAFLGPNVVIQPRSIIGAGCRVQAGCVIGSEPFDADKAGHGLMVASGGVEIGDHVTLQPNCVVGRATFGGFTKIGHGTLIDAGVSIAHDCVIGERVTICANASLSGRVTTGREVYIGPNAVISNGVALGDNSVVSIGSVVTKAVAPNTRVTGNFAMPHSKWLALIRKFR